MASRAQVLIRSAKGRANIELDIANAFGEIDRAFTLGAIREGPALMERPCSQLWKLPHTLWVETASGHWEAFSVYNGLLQGLRKRNDLILWQHPNAEFHACERLRLSHQQ